MDSSALQTLKPRLRRAFDTVRSATSSTLRRGLRVLLLVREAYDKLFEEEDALRKIRGDLGVLLRLAHAWATRRYTAVPWKTMLYAVGAITYFVLPIDLIPDFVAGIGFLDDIAVVTAVVHALQDDLRAFRAWERGWRIEDRGKVEGGE